MNRVQVNLPDELPFSTNLPIRITDLNYGNHVGNQVFFELIHEARVRYLKQLGYSELSFEGVGLIMADAAIEFKSELFYGDVAIIEIGPGSASRVGFDLYYRISAKRGEENILAAKAKTGMITYDYALKKVVAVPGAALIKMKEISKGQVIT